MADPVGVGGFSVETLTPPALPTLEALARAYYAEAGDEFGADQRRALAMLAGGDPLGHAWLIGEGGEPVGYIVASFGFAVQHGGRDAFIEELYVAPPWRGRGLGGAALAHVEAFLRRARVGTVHLAVKPALPRAQSLYRRQGFVDHGWRMMSKDLI